MSTSARPQPLPPAFQGRSAIVAEVSDTQGFVHVEMAALIRLIERVLRDEGVEQATISVALVDNATIRRINQKHLGHDWPTDVISFTLSAAGEPELAGELVVSTEMARATAAELGTEALSELTLYTIHGLLHLCGYDDSTESHTQEMRARERTHLSRHEQTTGCQPATFPGSSRNEEEQATWSV